jgi:menaquinol-cytochrome c reductase iron-sulfur subunit
MSEAPTKEGSDSQVIGRRKFLSTVTFGIGAFITAGFAIPGLAYLLAPAAKERTEGEWLPLGSTNKVEVGIPTLFKVTVTRQTGWIVNEEQLAVYVLTEDGRDFVAMSNICTHLGCRVRWIDDRDEFFCPCHNGVFDKTGAVESGPPPRPLDQYPVKVEGDTLFIQAG